MTTRLQNYHINVVIQLTSPLHVAAPEEARVDLKTDRITTAPEGLPIVRTQRYRLAPAMADSENGGELPRRLSVPIFPANDLRGRLRRKCATVLFQAIESRNEKLSLEAYHGLTCGAVTGQPSGRLTFDEAQKAGSHPFIGLFGGGPRFVHSALQVGTAWAITKETIGQGLCPDYEEEAVALTGDGLTQVLYFRRIDDALEYTAGSYHTIVKDYRAQIGAWLSEIKDNIAKRRPKGKAEQEASDEPVKKKALKGYNALEFVLPGTRFAFEIDIEAKQIGKAGVGLFLHGLRNLLIEQGLGGKAAIGFGRFSVRSATLKVAHRPQSALFDDKLEFNLVNNDVLEALDAWAEASNSINVPEIEYLFRLE